MSCSSKREYNDLDYKAELDKLKKKYLLQFSNNANAYSDEHARKKNADIRKLILNGNCPEVKCEAVRLAWQEFYKE